MEHILEKARELGQLIAQSDAFVNMNRLEDKIAQNPEVAELYAQYADLRDQIAAKEMEEGVSEEALDAMEEEAEEIQSRIARHDSMAEVNLARLTFNRLMDSINRALQAQLTGEDEFAEDEGCGSGGCAGCSGCGGR